ncbi:hypothetical protein [Nesterenkonia alba]|uniref:hypothetical protein n=1 Tax=Nesterenkonia alba TaxID=515814 RepID=UPI0003B6B20F|nr:hypothetical protein [Nesterenkonia alba]
MKGRYRSLLVYFMWLIAGIVIGATVALLWVEGFDPEWLQATGTWFGGVATVLTLLWAVRVFRTDQAHREAERQRRHEESLKSAQELEQQKIDEASRVSFEPRGGAGHGTGKNTKMTSLNLYFHNTTDRAVSVERLEFDEPLQSSAWVKTPIHLPPNDTVKLRPKVEAVPILQEELSDKPLKSYGARIVYTINGETWTRRAGEMPRRGK